MIGASVLPPLDFVVYLLKSDAADLPVEALVDFLWKAEIHGVEMNEVECWGKSEGGSVWGTGAGLPVIHVAAFEVNFEVDYLVNNGASF